MRRKFALPDIKIAIYIFVLLALINSVILIINIKNNARERGRSNTKNQIQSFLNTPAPDFAAQTFDNTKIVLSKFSKNVTILRFSNFYYEDLPYLLFLEYLSKKYSNIGVRLIFINTLGKHDYESVNNLVRLSSPIIEDDGIIYSLYNASTHETIIIGKDHKIKFKYPKPDNRMIFNQVLEILGRNPETNNYYLTEQLQNSIKNISFININDDKPDSLLNVINGKKAIINISISSCFGCPEGNRVKALKYLSRHYDDGKTQVIYLLGDGNSCEIAKELSDKMELKTYKIVVGVIQRKNNSNDDDYFRLFQLNIDPRLVIFNENGKLVFLEKEGEANKINQDYLIKNIQW